MCDTLKLSYNIITLKSRSVKQVSVLLSGRIGKNYQIPPNSRIVLEQGAAFSREDVGGQILYNNSSTSMYFTMMES